MKREYSIAAAVAGVLLLAGLLAWGFVTGHRAAATEAEHEETVKPAVQLKPNALGPPTLIVSDDLQRTAGIRLMPTRSAPYARELEAYGRILDLTAFTDLGNSIASLKAQREAAEAKLAASRAAFERAQALYRNNQNFSMAELQAAEATFRTDQASARAAQVQADNAVASAHQAWGPVLGQSLAADASLARDLISHTRILVEVALPLGASLAQVPKTASIETLGGQRVGIDLVSAAMRTDPEFQGESFFYTAQTAESVLPGMNVIVLLPAAQPTSGVFVPPSSVVWLQGRAWVYLRTGENAFTRHEIPTEEPQPGGGYVVPAAGGDEQGIPVGSDLVVRGAQALLSQEFSAQIEVGEEE